MVKNPVLLLASAMARRACGATLTFTLTVDVSPMPTPGTPAHDSRIVGAPKSGVAVKMVCTAPAVIVAVGVACRLPRVQVVEARPCALVVPVGVPRVPSVAAQEYAWFGTG